MFKNPLQLILNIQRKLYSSRLFFIRFVATILCLDFISFISLASIDVTYFLNPFHFMSAPPIDQRVQLMTFYPPAFSIKKKDQQSDYRGLIAVNQKVYQQNFSKKTIFSIEEKLSQNINLLIHELTIGVNNIRVKRAIKNKNLIRKIWIYEENLIIHLDKGLWNQLNIEEKTIIKDSIFLSVTENFSEIKDIVWTL